MHPGLSVTGRPLQPSGMSTTLRKRTMPSNDGSAPLSHWPGTAITGKPVAMGSDSAGAPSASTRTLPLPPKARAWARHCMRRLLYALSIRAASKPQPVSNPSSSAKPGTVFTPSKLVQASAGVPPHVQSITPTCTPSLAAIILAKK